MAIAWPRRRTLLVLAVLFEGSLGVLAWVVGWLIGQPPWKDLHWDPRDAMLGVAATLPLLALFALCYTLRWRPLVRIRRLCDDIIRPLFSASTVLDLAVIALVAGVAEELLFRGTLQPALARWLGPWPGVAAASVLFGLVHLLTPTYAVLATLVGVYLGWVYLATGNLLPVIVAHALYDFLALLFVGRAPKSVAAKRSEALIGLDPTDHSSTPLGSGPAATA
jgi:membrane protease YdiL (CAAX protease family)